MEKKTNFPGFVAEAALSNVYYETHWNNGTELLSTPSSKIIPQLSFCTPCLDLDPGPICINLGPFGRKCFDIPGFGNYKLCCRTRWGWPPISCSVNRC
jgi:hypothetical protein